MTVTFDLKRYGGGGRHGAKRENYNSRKSVILYRLDKTWHGNRDKDKSNFLLV